MFRASTSTALLATLAVAQTPPIPARLVLDLNDTPKVSASSSPAGFTAVGGRAYFIADDRTHGPELWSTDGTPGGTRIVVDLVPGPTGAALRTLGTLGPRLIFLADDGATGQEPWITDGTAAGTHLLADLNPGPAPSAFDLQVVYDLGRRAVFFPHVQRLGSEPWVTDGTAAGTALLADLAPGGASSTSTSTWDLQLVRTGPSGRPVVWFRARVAGIDELWETDGTLPGTRRLLTLPRPGAMYGPPVELPNGRVVFVSDVLLVPEIWSTDGTAAGTFRVGQLASYEARAHRPVVLGGRAWFGGMRAVPFISTDGTRTGTRYHQPSPGMPTTEYVAPIGAMHNAVWGIAPDGRLIRSDATQLTVTATGYVPFGVDRLQLLSQAGVPQLGGRFVLDDDDQDDSGLWSLDPLTAAATRLADDFAPQGSRFAIELGNDALFAIDAGPLGVELGATDGTAAGTRLLRDIKPPAPNAQTFGSDPRMMTAFGNRVVFQATTQNGDDLWITDGTAAGTRRISDGLPNAGHLTACGDQLFFTAFDAATGRELYATDGTLAGTRLVGEVAWGPSGEVRGPLASFGDVVAFASYTNTTTSLHVSDGRSIRTVVTVPRTLVSYPTYGVFRLGQLAVFRVDGATGTEFWASDLAPGNATRIATLALPVLPLHRAPAVWRDRLWFLGLDSAGITQLFATDGTAAGTGQVGQRNISSPGSQLQMVVAGDDRVFAVSVTGIWVSDGSAAGTGAVPLPAGRTVRIQTTPGHTLGGRLLLELQNPSELWITDGTVAGTHRLSDAAWPDSPPRAFLVSGRRDVLFAGIRTSGGSPSLWLSDGRPDAAIELQALPLPPSADGVTRWAATGGFLLFGGSDPRFGAEPYVFVPGANVQPRGAPCAAGSRTPSLVADYDPRNDPQAILQLDGWSSAGTAGTVLLSRRTELPALFPAIPHCAVDVDLLGLAPLATVTIRGQAFGTAIAIPRVPALQYVQFAAVAATFPTDSPTGFDLTAGLLITIGD